jgi:ketosteroid isomerase-like protein
MSEDDVQIVRRLFEAQVRRDADTIGRLYAPDIQWIDVSGLWGDWGVRRGREDIRDAFATWYEAFEDVSFEGEDYLDTGDHVVVDVRIRGRGRGSGVAINHHITLVWAVRDGRVTHVAGYRDRREALAALALRE